MRIRSISEPRVKKIFLTPVNHEGHIRANSYPQCQTQSQQLGSMHIMQQDFSLGPSHDMDLLKAYCITLAKKLLNAA